ncbi:MAG: FeoB-associated Cys-rich membrane protein [Flavobacteriales bacterium]|nr:FeoB-associated Cys-rich membrane protein [Flavobacteriales bacterium]MCB9363518.1 FeoB-associated Cys-rich membrane protein [Flavobacteriales bacterium]
METQEIYVIILIALSVGYIAYRVFKNAKDHDCDKCALKDKPRSKD